jgi:hypothetical protein
MRAPGGHGQVHKRNEVLARVDGKVADREVHHAIHEPLPSRTLPPLVLLWAWTRHLIIPRSGQPCRDDPPRAVHIIEQPHALREHAADELVRVAPPRHGARCPSGRPQCGPGMPAREEVCEAIGGG